MGGFELLEEVLIPLDRIPDEEIAALVDCWEQSREGRPFAPRKAMDPVTVPEMRRSVRIAMIEGDGVFRFRFYASMATNPDRSDMSGKTTRDYADQVYAEMVTRHYQTVADDAVPRCWGINGRVGCGVYAYLRVILPISYSESRMDALLIRSTRVQNPDFLTRF